MIKYYEIMAHTPLAGCDEYMYIRSDELKRDIEEIANDFAYDVGEEAFEYSGEEDFDYEDFMEACGYVINEISEEEYNSYAN